MDGWGSRCPPLLTAIRVSCTGSCRVSDKANGTAWVVEEGYFNSVLSLADKGECLGACPPAPYPRAALADKSECLGACLPPTHPGAALADKDVWDPVIPHPGAALAWQWGLSVQPTHLPLESLACPPSPETVHSDGFLPLAGPGHSLIGAGKLLMDGGGLQPLEQPCPPLLLKPSTCPPSFAQALALCCCGAGDTGWETQQTQCEPLGCSTYSCLGPVVSLQGS